MGQLAEHDGRVDSMDDIPLTLARAYPCHALLLQPRPYRLATSFRAGLHHARELGILLRPMRRLRFARRLAERHTVCARLRLYAREEEIEKGHRFEACVSAADVHEVRFFGTVSYRNSWP